MNKSKLMYLYGIGILLFLWYLACFIKGNTLIIPYPHTTFINTLVAFTKLDTIEAIFYSLFRVIVVFLISLISASCLAVLSYLKKNIRRLLQPIISTIRAIPNICLLFIFILFLPDVICLYGLLFFIAFPLLYEHILSATLTLPSNYIDEFYLNYRPTFINFSRVFYPLILQNILSSGLALFGLILKIEIMAEIFVGITTLKGMGKKLHNAFNVTFDYNQFFVWILIITSIVAGFDAFFTCIKSKVNDRYKV